MTAIKRSHVPSVANVCSILLLLMHHVSNVQGFVRRSTKVTFVFSSKCHFAYPQLQSLRCISNPYYRDQGRLNNRSIVCGNQVIDTGTSRVSRLMDRLWHTIPFQRRNVAVEKVEDSQSTKREPSPVRFRNFFFAIASASFGLVCRPTLVLAMGAIGGSSKGPVASVSKKDALSLFGVFFGLFVGLALLHAAEIAITTLYPWKVREFAEEVSLKVWTELIFLFLCCCLTYTWFLL
jgi:hypothetical protein